MINCTSPERAAYGWDRDGGHADLLLAEENTLVALPDKLTFVDGSLVACGLGTVYEACRKAGVSGRDIVLVTGLGPVGLGTVMLSKAMGARVIGIEPTPERAKLAEKVGADLVLEPNHEIMRSLMEYTDGRGVEAAIECSGSTQARQFCLEATREWGRVVYVGEDGPASFEPGPFIHKQLTLYGSWVCGIAEMEELVDLLVRWKLHPERLVTHYFQLEQAKEAYEIFDCGKTGKVVIVW
jgi:threonine dehydrogenase-like Zn-dependent dehydrogenase